MPPIAKEELQERAQLVRVHEANCNIDHPTPNEMVFRMAVMKKIALSFSLGALKDKELAPSAGKPHVPQPTIRR